MSSLFLFSNNAQTTLAGSITNVAVTANLSPGSGAEFPNPSAGQLFVGTFNDAATGLLFEIVHVTAISGDTITMVRAQEGTSALPWSAGDIFGNFWTAGQAAAMLQTYQGQQQSTNYAADTGSANAIVAAFSPVLSTYTVGSPMRVKIANTTTSQSVTFNGGPSSLNVVMPGGGLPPVGGLVAGSIYEFRYDGTNAEVRPVPQAAPVQGAFKNLSIANTNTTATITADQIVVQDSHGNSFLVQNVNVTINYAASGANGLDTGSFSASTAYFHWVIYNPTTGAVAGLGSTSSTLGGLTLPSGYTMAGRVGGNFTDGSTHLYGVVQKGKRAQYTTARQIAQSNSPVGTISGASWSPVAESITGIVPTTASRISAMTAVSNSVGGFQSICNPNSGWGPVPAAISATTVTGTNTANANMGEFTLESTNIYWASNSTGSAANSLWCLGWEDNL